MKYIRPCVIMAMFALASAQGAVTLSVQNVTSTTPGGGTNPFAVVDLRCGTDPNVITSARAGSFALSGNTSKGTWSNQMAFCIEVSEPVSGGGSTYTFNEIPVENAAAGSAVGGAGLDHLHSGNIPQGGIGALRAARVEWLFENYYRGVSASDWQYGTNSLANAYAFQLAIWEASHDTDLTLTAPADLTGYQGFAVIPKAGEPTKTTYSVAQAQVMLSALAAANVTEGYRSSKWEVMVLANNGANQSTSGTQDLVTAVAIPEPSVVGLSVLAVGGMLLRRRRK